MYWRILHYDLVNWSIGQLIKTHRFILSPKKIKKINRNYFDKTINIRTFALSNDEHQNCGVLRETIATINSKNCGN